MLKRFVGWGWFLSMATLGSLHGCLWKDCKIWCFRVKLIFICCHKRKPSLAAFPTDAQLEFVIKSIWTLTSTSCVIGLGGLLGCTSRAFTQMLSLWDTAIYHFDNTLLIKISLVIGFRGSQTCDVMSTCSFPWFQDELGILHHLLKSVKDQWALTKVLRLCSRISSGGLWHLYLSS